MLKRFSSAFFGIVLAAHGAAQTTLHVAAAADLQPVLPPILAEFEMATGIHAEGTYQASATLTTQIQNGAPFDVFLSADLSYPQKLIDAGLAEGLENRAAPVTYAKGTLVLWERKDSGFPAPSLDLLKDARLKRLAIADPDRAPYGRAAVAALTSLKLYEELKPRLVTGDNIAQTAQFADSGNADAGLISLTGAMTAQMTADGSYFVMPRDLYPPIEQGMVIIAKTAHHAGAQKLLEFLLSKRVQSELEIKGLTPVR